MSGQRTTHLLVYLLHFLLLFSLLSSPTPSFAFSSLSSVRVVLNMNTQNFAMDGVAVFGCGVLGTRLCQHILSSYDFRSRFVMGITKTSTNHALIREKLDPSRFNVQIAGGMHSERRKYRDVVFCAPPSGFENYAGAVERVMRDIWLGSVDGEGSFVLTSSGGVYGSNIDGETVNESSPTDNPNTNPRAKRLIHAEKKCLDNGGVVLRLGALYTLERGPHSYWLNTGKDVIGRGDKILNMLHYDDAVAACVAALQTDWRKVAENLFLISDGNPSTREGICRSARKTSMYRYKRMPKFLEVEGEPRGKIYDGSVSNNVLRWQPMYESFDRFMFIQT